MRAALQVALPSRQGLPILLRLHVLEESGCRCKPLDRGLDILKRGAEELLAMVLRINARGVELNMQRPLKGRSVVAVDDRVGVLAGKR